MTEINSTSALGDLPDPRDAQACLRYAKRLARGRGASARNFEEAVHYFDLSAQLENVDAMYWLGKCYLKGLGCLRDPHGGVSCLENAANRGHLAAARKLADCFAKGLGAPCCAELSRYWKLRADALEAARDATK